MRIFRSEDSYTLGPSVAALGTFDGVHIGHQKLISTAMTMAQELEAASVVCTFDRHPLSLLCPERAPAPLMTLEERLHRLELMGVQGVLLHAFTPEFAAIEPEKYLEELTRKLQLRGVVAGFNYSFGAGGRGNAALICSEAKRLGWQAAIVGAVTDGEDTVSSTLIRKLLAQGDMARAERLMRLGSVKL